MKKILTVLAFLLTMTVCGSAFTSCCCCINSDEVLFEYVSNGDGTCSVKAKSDFLLIGDVVIPSVSPDGDIVTGIDEYGFSCCDYMTGVTIPDTVAVIDAYAFEGCSGLERVNIPNSVTEIRAYAFRNCTSLTSAFMPYNVERIAESTFEGCESLETVSIRTSVKYIGEYAFEGCTSLERVLYEGNEYEWGQISIGWNNEPLYKATVYYGEYAEYNPVY